MSSPCSYEDYFLDEGIPDQGCVIEFPLNQQLLSSEIRIADSAVWEIPELQVRQESFAHAGYEGTITGLLQKVHHDVEMMRSGYSIEYQVKIDNFLLEIQRLISDGIEVKCEYHLRIQDPSGVSRVFVESLSINDLAKQSNYQRDFFEKDSLGLIEDRSTTFNPEEQISNAKDIAELIQKSNRIVCLSGAGISVESGIPPFRTTSSTSSSIWGEFDANQMTVQGFNTCPLITTEWWRMKHSLLPKISAALPNPAHNFFTFLEAQNKLSAIVTQNIDSLHQRAGVSPNRIIELHGHMRGLICSNHLSKFNPIPSGDGSCTYVCPENICLRYNYFHPDSSVVDDPDFAPLPQPSLTPLCPHCSSPLRTETVMFGQPIVQSDYLLSLQTIEESDLFIVIGSSLIVQPANLFPLIAQKLGIPIILLTLDETSYDQYAAGLVREPAGKFLAKVQENLELLMTNDGDR